MRLFNKVPGNVSFEPEPVFSKLTRQQQRAVSEWMLLPHHRTKNGEDPNMVQCVNWVLGTGEYVKAVNRVKGTQASMIKAVKWPKVTLGTSHLERFFQFSSDLGDVIRKIPEA